MATDSNDWTTPYISYLDHQVLPQYEMEARMIQWRYKSFVMIDNELYIHSVSGVFQRCISPEEGHKILYDIHAGDCGHHARAHLLIAKAMRHGFYWLMAHADAVDIVRRYAGYQKYANQTHMPSSALKMMPITWPFAVWGLDMVGQFKRAPGGHTHLLVAINKFTKWIEAKPITKCDGKTTTKSTAMVSRTASSPTMAPTSSRVPSRSSIASIMSDSMWPQLPIPSQTAKKSAPTRASSIA
jgi:hypothetical protein